MKNKYMSRKKKNKPTIDGFVFDSQPEYSRYIELKLFQKKGLISTLEVHPKFHLARPAKNEHGQKIRGWNYTADFKYYDVEKRIVVVEDVKSLHIDKNGKKHGTSQSRDYKLTRNAFMRKFPEIYFKEVV